jgi:hypothetical protein
MARDRHTKPAECFEFVWRRRVKGPAFRWERDARGRWLLLGPPEDALVPYEPLAEETGLFLTFARRDGGREALLGFANEYGRLGTYHRILLEHGEPPAYGEPLDEWQRHHRWMRFLAELRSECAKDRPALGGIVGWRGDEVVFGFPKIGTGETETWRHRGWLRKRLLGKSGAPLFRPDDLVGPARWFLGHAINEWLQELEGRGQPIAPRLVWSEQEGRPQLVFGPSSLLGAMVCQLAAAVHGGWPFQECACCHRFFRLAPGVNRANRLTCSRTCKQYLHNRRVERARALHAAGRTARQIARELSVKPQGQRSGIDVVRAWIARG